MNVMVQIIVGPILISNDICFEILSISVYKMKIFLKFETLFFSENI